MLLTFALLVSSYAGIASQKVMAAVTFPTEKIFEAEAGTVASPMQVYSDKGDASGSYMMVPTSYPSAAGPFAGTATPEVSYSLDIASTNVYQVWARVYAPDGARDSFFYEFDNAASYTPYYISADSADWQWVKVTSVSLTQGAHDLKIKYRESGMGFDRFIVTSNVSYTPSGTGEDPVVLPETIYPNPYPTPTVTPPSGHPRLYVRSSDIPRIKENLTKGELVKVWTNVVNTSKQNVTGKLPLPATGAHNYDDNTRKVIEANALLYLLNGDNAAGQKAVSVMYNFFNTAIIPLVGDSTRTMGQVIVTGAMVYDWCYDLMTDEQRLNFRQNMARIAANMEIGYPPAKQGALVSHAAEAQLMRDLLAFGVAAYDENPNIYEISAGRFFKEYVDGRNYMYESGWQPMGDSYGMYRYQWDLFATFLFDRMGAGDVFSEQQGQLPYQSIYTSRPDGQRLRNGDTFSSNQFGMGSYWTNDILAQMLASSYYKDPVLRGEFLKEYNYGTSNYMLDDIYMVLFDDPNVQAKSEATLPLSRYFGDPAGTMIARTGWNGGFNSSVVVAEMNIGGVYFANHQHLDAGSFQLYYKGGLAIDSGVYQGKNGSYGSSHDLNYNKRTIAHNSMLVYDPAETFQYYGTTLGNDGGQRTPNNLAEPSVLSDLLDPAKGYRTAEVLNHGFGPDPATPDYTYIKGDLTKAYSSKVEDYKRSMVFLNMKNKDHPGVLLVYDKLTSSNPDFKKTWLLHSQTEPEINGDTTTVRRNDNGYNGKLVNKTLMPAADNATITKVGGPGNEYSVGGVNYPNAQSNQVNSDESGAWRVEVSPVMASATDEFLNVMQVMDDAGGPMPLAVEQVTGDKMVGAKISDRVVLFGKESQPLNDTATFTVSGSDSDLYVLATDLAPGYWTVVKDGEAATVQYQVTEEQGGLYFQGSAGSYTLTRYESRIMPEPQPVANIPLPAENSIVMKLDGTPLASDLRAEVIDGTVMLPGEAVLGALGARLEEDSAAQTLAARKLGEMVEITVGSHELKVNGTAILLETPAKVVNGKIYIPISLLPITGWGKAAWDEFYQIVTIASIKPTANNGLTGVAVSDGGLYAGEYTVDGNLSTRWSAPGDQAWISYDLGSVKPLNRIGIAWYKGNERHAVYEIQTSENGNDWATAYSGQSSGLSAEMEETLFTTVKARYIRIVGHGYVSEYGLIRNNSIAEVSIYSGQISIPAVSTISETPGYEGNKTLDGDSTTYWTVEGDNKWIQYDLGAVKKANGVGTAWIKGNVRQQLYDILVSADGSSWTTVFAGRNSGTTLEMENVYFTDIQARYIRILGHGNSVSGWNSLAETAIYGVSSALDDSALAAGQVSITDSTGNGASTLAPNEAAVVKMPVMNNGSDAAEVTLAAAWFRNDEPENLQVVKAVLQPGETKELSVAVVAPGDTTDCYLKVFLWDRLQHPVVPTLVFPEPDLALQGITVGGAPLAGFDPDVLNYTVVPSGILSGGGIPQVAGTAASPSATVTVAQAAELDGTATITVTDSLGVKKKVYQIKYQVISTDATLKELKVNGVPVPGLTVGVTHYTMGMTAMDVAAYPVVTVTAATYNPNAVALITQPTGVPGNATIRVTAQDGLTVLEYTLDLALVKSSDASLLNLKVGNSTVPGFASGILTYTYNYAPSGTPQLSAIPQVSATATDSLAQVVVTQAKALPGSAVATVTAEDGVTVKQYVVNYNSINVNGNSVITAAQNAYVSATSPNSNYHSSAASPYLNVTGGKQQTYMKFDLAGVTGNATSAVVSMRAQTWGGTVTLSVYAVDDDSWSETGITWNTKPADGQLLGSTSVDTTWKEWNLDITGLISSILSADPSNPAHPDRYISIVIESSSATGTVQISSRDKDYYPPYLRIKTN